MDVVVGDSTGAGVIARLWRLPFTRMLGLSLGLHVAVVMIVQPRPHLPQPEITVISARLLERTQDQAEAEVLPPSPVTPVEASDIVEPVPMAPPEPVPVPVVETKPVVPPPVPRPAPKPEPAPPQPVAAPKPEPAVPPPETPVERKPPSTPPATEAPALPSIPVMVDAHWYEAKQLDAQPKAAAKIVPLYPPAASRNGIEGTVKLKLRIDEFGVVREVEVEEGDPPGVFDESALDAFGKGRFKPAIKDGRPVRALIYIRVRYELGED